MKLPHTMDDKARALLADKRRLFAARLHLPPRDHTYKVMMQRSDELTGKSMRETIAGTLDTGDGGPGIDFKIEMDPGIGLGTVNAIDILDEVQHVPESYHVGSGIWSHGRIYLFPAIVSGGDNPGQSLMQLPTGGGRPPSLVDLISLLSWKIYNAVHLSANGRMYPVNSVFVDHDTNFVALIHQDKQ